ncbi:unnamed protein product [Musa acuminata subsp. malaccensis]|uniref:(wild Malaysian banana) hypothetical protein n=1 Tax=Musa acuminata subsp. malaccensis TaxID=214687 RepID=A0A804JPR6_MUSAM|nr:unnamed protein product [Musa acuminata subsp. malaccensis]
MDCSWITGGATESYMMHVRTLCLTKLNLLSSRLLHLARADTTLSHLHSEMLFYVPFLVSFIVILTLNIKSV